MLAYPTQAENDLVRIDANHASFLRALVMCVKPRRVLEFGFGAGEATRSILDGLRYNEKSFEYTVVDNWVDFSGIQPALTRTEEFSEIKFVTSGEREFVAGRHGDFDFIFSDADHRNTEQWFEQVYANLLSHDGVLIYHDVTNPDLPNLFVIFRDTVRKNYDYILLNASSRRDERCERGMLVIFKH